MFGLLKRKPKPPSEPTSSGVHALPRKTAGALQIADPASHLELHRPLIKRIVQTMGLKSEDVWMVEDACAGVAAYFLNMPYSRGGNHREEGGALRYALEVAFTSVQSTEGVIFSGLETAERRRDLEPAWKYATLLAALTADIHVPVMDRLIVGTTSDSTWMHLRGSLWAWACASKDSEYMLQWRDASVAPSPSISGYLLPHALPLKCTEYVLRRSPLIITSMLNCIIGVFDERDVLCQTVKNSRQSVKDRDDRAHSDRPVFARAGTIEHQIVEIMRNLVESGKWGVNDSTAAIFITDLGVLVRWSVLRSDVPNIANKIGLTGLPFSDAGMSELLHASGVLNSFGSDGLIQSMEIMGKVDSFVRLSDEAYLFSTTQRYQKIDIGNSGVKGIPSVAVKNVNQGTLSTVVQEPVINARQQIAADIDATPQPSADSNQQDVLRMMEKLGLASRMLLQHIARDIGRQDVNQYLVQEIDGSCWIAAELITQYGFDHGPVFNELAASGMLVTADGRRNVKEKREIAGKKREAALLRREVYEYICSKKDVKQ